LVSVSLHQVGKKFGREWIFRNLDLEIPACSRMAILGGNGSGKSTLLQVISGFVTPNVGEIVYKNAKGSIDQEEVLKYVSFASPYLQLTEDFTLTEQVEHVNVYKPFLQNMPAAMVLDEISLPTMNKPIKHFSSGMKQKVRLALAILADTPLLLLDEPVSNLDKAAIAWYKMMMQKYGAGRTVIVCSNAVPEEFEFCDLQLNVADYKR
jgi:ABC-type multidrug transport system ATPase subunit